MKYEKYNSFATTRNDRPRLFSSKFIPSLIRNEGTINNSNSEVSHNFSDALIWSPHY